MFEVAVHLPKRELAAVQRYAGELGLTLEQAARILIGTAISTQVYEIMEKGSRATVDASASSECNLLL